MTRLALAGAVLVLVGFVVSPAHATCGDFDRSFGSFPSSGPCGAYCYVASPGDSTLASMEGFYWSLGSGASRNSGAYEFDGTGGSQAWGVQFTNGWSIGSTVNNGATTGCPDGLNLVFVFSDTGGGSSFYGIAATDETLAGAQVYDLGLAGTLNLQPMPNCTITNTSRGPGGELIVDLSWTPNAAFTTSSSVVTSVGQVITGWNFYSREVPRGDPAPSERDIGLWTLRGTVPGDASSSGQITFACDDPANNEVFLAIAPDLDNGFTSTAYVGGNSTRIECDPNIADPADRKNFKLIDKPSKLKRR